MLMIIVSFTCQAQVARHEVKLGHFSRLSLLDDINVNYRCHADSAGLAVFTCTQEVADHLIFTINSSGRLSVQVDDAFERQGNLPTITLYFTNYVDHTAGQVHYKVTVRDQFGMEIAAPTPVEMTLSGGGEIDADLVFTTDGTNGEYAVTATTGDFTQNATVKVATALTEVVTYPAIELNETTLSASESFDVMGEDATATLPQAWRIDRILTAPRTLGRYDQADDQTMYSVNRTVDL